MNDADRDLAIRVARDRAKRAEKQVLREFGRTDILWIVDCTQVDRSIWCDFWEGKFPNETEASIKWALGLPAQERDAQLGILRPIGIGKAPMLRPSGHQPGIVEAYLAPDNDRAIALVTLARICETRSRYIKERINRAQMSRSQRRSANRKARTPETLPGEGFSNTEFGRICRALARDITRK